VFYDTFGTSSKALRLDQPLDGRCTRQRHDETTCAADGQVYGTCDEAREDERDESRHLGSIHARCWPVFELRGARVPDSALSGSRIEITPEYETGCSLVQFEATGINLSRYVRR
jgi:hypothetical protein